MRSALYFALFVVACGSPSQQTGTDGGGSGGGSNGSGSGSGSGSGTGSGTTPGAITVIVEPNGNKGQEVVDAINGAQHSVYMTVYELDNAGVISALVSRKNAGVDVKVLLDGSSTTRSNNSGAYATLSNASVPVKYTVPEGSGGPFALTHEKTFIIDDSVAWITSMNLDTGPPQYNREYLAIDTSAGDVAEATAIFQSDFANPTGTPISASGDLVVSPSTAGGNSETDLAALIGQATSTLDVEVEELGGTNKVVQAIAAAAKRGVTVHVVVANSPPLDTTADNSIKSAGGTIVMTGPTSSNGTQSNPYIHGKAILVDCSGTSCAKGFVGSENDSTQSLLYNRELGVIFTDAAELAKIKTAIDTDFAAGTAQ